MAIDTPIGNSAPGLMAHQELSGVPKTLRVVRTITIPSAIAKEKASPKRGRYALGMKSVRAVIALTSPPPQRRHANPAKPMAKTPAPATNRFPISGGGNTKGADSANTNSIVPTNRFEILRFFRSLKAIPTSSGMIRNKGMNDEISGDMRLTRRNRLVIER